MDRSRRSFLKGLAAAGGAAAGVSAAAASTGPAQAPADAVGMLYDTTLCIGCKTCVVACHEANGLEPDNRQDPLHDAPTALNSRTKNIIKLYQGERERSYVKQQCMHCLDPACTRACMMGSLQKREHGIVTWDASRCIGCRYCQVACPYEVPKVEWESASPRIVKCELCNHRIAEGGQPACCEVCPREAVIYGTREELLAEAHRRLEASPGRYVPKVYGETDGGGSQVLYLSHVEFEKLGLPALGEEGAGARAAELQHGIYKGFIAPAVLYVALAGVTLRNRRSGDDEGGES